MKNSPLVDANTYLPEFTIKSIVLSLVLAVVLAASNIYLALKIGSTIAASIPASVISLGILRLFRRWNVLECNMIQTAASAGEGIAAAAAYFLPAMLILNIWSLFPYWQIVVVVILGGCLGALFSVPLRRILFKMPALAFPEGIAIGNVMKSVTLAKKDGGFKYLATGGIFGGLITFLQSGLYVIANNFAYWVYVGRTVVGFNLGFASATLAAGYIIGFETGLILLIGLVSGWIILLPIIGYVETFPSNLSPAQSAMFLWSQHLRFIGVGLMFVGGLWTLFNLSKSLWAGVVLSFKTFKDKTNANLPKIRTERDIPNRWLFVGICILMAILAVVLYHYVLNLHLVTANHFLWLVILFCLLFILLYGLMIAAVSSHICALIGSTSSPISGIMIAAVIGLSLVFLLIFNETISENAGRLAVLVIIISTILAGVASIAGENIQDLKAGQMVGATPWKQQVMMMIGVVVSAFVVAPVLNLLLNAYGIGGVFPKPGMDASEMLPAPQSALMASIVNGVFGHSLNWNMIILGCLLGIVCIILDFFTQKKQLRLPPLVIGLGIYLPPEVLSPIIIGSFVQYLVKKNQLTHLVHQNSVLLACGLVAGSAIMGVLIAIPFVIAGNANVLSLLTPGLKPFASVFGFLTLLALAVWLYRTGTLKD